MTLATGQSISHYEILGPLGVGAMGEVYRARDTHLKRKVAIKVLPEELAGDEERLKRFEREARTLACLSHPHVAQVFDIDKADSTSFMTMELVPGKDLAQRLKRGPLEVDQALEVCRQIAEGVEAAHEAGVIHRDLKPANVILTPDGQVKLLDFGLAKPIAPGVEDGSIFGGELTIDKSNLLGTPVYMSPEQIRGQAPDKRVDVWGFGCVLFECLTGRKTFGGPTLGDTLVGVLEKEPDWSKLPRETPARVRALLRRCLDKDPRARLRDMGEARIVLGEGESDAETKNAVESAPARLSRIQLLGGLAAVAVVVFGSSWLLAPDEHLRNPLIGATWTHLTNYEGTEFGATLSPDGNTVSFVWDKEGEFDLFTCQVGTGRPMNRTHGSNKVWHNYLSDGGFNADSSEVWLAGGRTRRLKFMPLQGGVFASRYAEKAVSIDWTRDGSRVVYHTFDDGDPLFVARGREHPQEPILKGPPGVHQHHPLWSFDDERIFFVRGRPSTEDMDLWWVRPDGRDPEQLTHGLKSVIFPAPISEQAILFIADDRKGAGLSLFVMDLDTREYQRVEQGVAQFTSVSASADGKKLVATESHPRGSLWTMPIRQAIVTEADVNPVEDMPTLRAIAPRFQGEDLYYFSSRGSGDGLWRLRDGNAEEIWQGGERALLSPPSFSADGRFAAIVTSEGSKVVLSLLDTDSSEVVGPLNGGLEVRGAPSWSPDGQWIVIAGKDKDGHALFKIGVGDRKGEIERLVEGEVLNPLWSPRGDMIVYTGIQLNALMPLRAVDPEGEPVVLPDIGVRRAGERYRFLLDGSGLIYMQGLNYSQDFHLLDLTTMESRVLSELEGTATMRTFDVSPDGSSIVFDRVQPNSDIVLIELAGQR